MAAHERLNQNSTNSAKPPSSQAPWVRSGDLVDKDEKGADPDEDDEKSSTISHDSEDAVTDDESEEQLTQSANDSSKEKTSNIRCKQGKQPGASRTRSASYGHYEKNFLRI